MKPQLTSLKKFNYGKQIAAIEKLIFAGSPSYPAGPSVGTAAPASLPIEIASSAATPLLTDGQNSPQSSSLPSTNVSTIDDPAEPIGKPCPEVVVNGL